MLQSTLINVSADDYQERTEGKRVVLIYPWLHYRNLFLAHVLETTPDDNLLYYRVTENDDSLEAFLRNSIAELRDTVSDFGEQTLATLDDTTRAQDLAKAYAADLATLTENKSWVYVLDELDRVPFSRDFRKFLRNFTDIIPETIQLVINARTLIYEHWIDLIDNEDAVVFGTAHRSDDLMFTVTDERKPQLEIYAFGPGHAVVNGREVVTWDGALPRNLFFYFVDNELVTRDEIFEVFWPDLSVKEATNVFHVTKRKITERLSSKVFDHGNYELTQYGNGFYTPSNKLARHYDAADFEATLDEALMTLDEDDQAAMYKRAIEMYRAPFLQSIDMPWVLDRREKLQRQFTDALISMGRIRKDQERLEEAIGYFVRSLKEIPHREDIHREVMELYWRLGRLQDAHHQYDRLRAHLEQSVGIAPSAETEALYERISS